MRSVYTVSHTNSVHAVSVCLNVKCTVEEALEARVSPVSPVRESILVNIRDTHRSTNDLRDCVVIDRPLD